MNRAAVGGWLEDGGAICEQRHQQSSTHYDLRLGGKLPSVDAETGQIWRFWADDGLVRPVDGVEAIPTSRAACGHHRMIGMHELCGFTYLPAGSDP